MWKRRIDFLQPQSAGRHVSTSKTAGRFLDGFRKRLAQNAYDLGKSRECLTLNPWHILGKATLSKGPF
jgi:hypothetical protein